MNKIMQITIAFISLVISYFLPETSRLPLLVFTKDLINERNSKNPTENRVFLLLRISGSNN
jgi:hypothetical protein